MCLVHLYFHPADSGEDGVAALMVSVHLSIRSHPISSESAVVRESLAAMEWQLAYKANKLQEH